MTSQDYRNPLTKAKGIGSAKGGMHHWLMQRITGLVLVFCVIWIFYFACSISGKSPAEVVSLLQKPYNAITLMILIITSFYHAAIGMQVVIEDYIPNLCLRYGLILLVKLFSYLTIICGLAAMIYLMVL
jgi:succinate dehydrogenase / fumarate reductase membrane anchor subunit